ncbi:hypothetical protein F5888DRAFT_1636885 [Russula emetica]|nr:hypothetical protein F5888DRAFT_1636885 [Russula emetica]
MPENGTSDIATWETLLSVGPVFDSNTLKQTHMDSVQRILNQMPSSMTSTTNQKKLHEKYRVEEKRLCGTMRHASSSSSSSSATSTRLRWARSVVARTTSRRKHKSSFGRPIWRRRWQHLSTLPRNSANGAVAHVTLDDEGPETNTVVATRINYKSEVAKDFTKRFSKRYKQRTNPPIFRSHCYPLVQVPALPRVEGATRIFNEEESDVVPEDLSGDRYSPIKGKGQTAEQNSSARQLDPESLENSGGPTARSVAEVWPYGYFSGQSAVIALLLFVVFHLLQYTCPKQFRHIVPNTSRITLSPSDLPPQLWKWTGSKLARLRAGSRAATSVSPRAHTMLRRMESYVRERNEKAVDDSEAHTRVPRRRVQLNINQREKN